MYRKKKDTGHRVIQTSSKKIEGVEKNVICLLLSRLAQSDIKKAEKLFIKEPVTIYIIVARDELICLPRIKLSGV